MSTPALQSDMRMATPSAKEIADQLIMLQPNRCQACTNRFWATFLPTSLALQQPQDLVSWVYDLRGLFEQVAAFCWEEHLIRRSGAPGSNRTPLAQ